MFLWLYDWLWALVVFFRGKVLKQKKYQPKRWDNSFLLKFEITASKRRLRFLFKLWGLSPIDVEKYPPSEEK